MFVCLFVCLFVCFYLEVDDHLDVVDDEVLLDDDDDDDGDMNSILVSQHVFFFGNVI